MFKRYIEYYKRHKLRVNMIAVNTAISVIPLIIVGVIAYNIYLGSVTENMSRSIEMSFQQMNGRIDEYFSNMNNLSKSIFFNKTVLDILSSDPKLLKSQSVFEAREYFASVLQMNKSYRGAYLITNEGKQVGTGNFKFGEEVLNYIEKNKEIIDNNNNLLFLAPDSIEQLNLSGIVAIRQIRFVSSFKKAGIGILLLDRKNLINLVESTYQTGRIKVFIFDAKDKLVAATDENDMQLLDTLKNAKENQREEITVGNKRYYIKKTTQAATKWRFIAVAPVDELYKEGTILKYTIIVIVLVILSLTIAATLFFNVSISAQIKKLADAFDKVASGDMKVRLNFKAKNEITVIGNNFNYMVQEIKSLTKKMITTQQRLYEAELEKTEAELYGLQSQINSHFLYNTLGSIRGMARSGAIEEVDTMINDLVCMLRYATSKAEFVKLKNEIEHLQYYIGIQKTSFKRLKIKTDISDEAAECIMPKLILQPIVENSILHGFNNRIKGTIKINAKRLGDNIIIKVFDNGEGMSGSKLTMLNSKISSLTEHSDSDGKHIGLINIQKRLRATFGKCGISIKSWEGIGTVVIVTIPAAKRNKSGRVLNNV